ncbi:MAG: hypothetical protein K0Q49_272 [Haloplasmataceae bacterium]|jgi:hypothetical protein|nr:hypothetical protein [Haloplasmataceae bacterium]
MDRLNENRDNRNNCDDRNDRNNRNDRNDRNNVEFATLGSVPGMSQEAKAGTQEAAQRNKTQNTAMNTNMNALNQQTKTDTEFAQGIGAQGYNAYSEEAKARTKAAVQQNQQSSSQSK